MVRRCLIVLVLGLAVLTPAPPAWGQDPHKHRAIESTLNVYRGNPAWMIQADVRAAMRRASVIRLQETYPPKAWGAVRSVVRNSRAWVMTKRPPRLEVPVMWDRRIWRGAGPAHWVRLSDSARFPARWLVWKALVFLGSGQTVTIANVHPDPGACRGDARAWQPDRQAAAREHWTGVADWTRRQRARHPSRTILLGGDFNCLLSARARPYFPGRILAPLYRFDHSGSIDRLITSRTPGHPIGVRRWATDAYSDHRAQFRALRFR